MLPEDFLRNNLREVLSETEAYRILAVSCGQEALVNPSATYACAILAVIRLNGIFETEKAPDGVPRLNKFEPFFFEVTDRERRGVMTTRHIASHRSYMAMDDDTLWKTLSVDMPVLMNKLRRAADLPEMPSAYTEA